MQDDERYVRERWLKVAVFEDSSSCALDLFPESGDQDFSPFDIERTTSKQAWSAARAFTEQREEEIRQLDEEIEIVKASIFASHQYAVLGNDLFSEKSWVKRRDTWQRILGRLESIRADLKRGMKEQP